MSIPLFLYDQQIINIIDRLILEEGYRSYSEVDDLDQDSLSVLAMQALGEDTYITITDSADFDNIVHNLTKYILQSTTDNAVQLASNLKSGVIDFFRQDFTDLFAERFDQINDDLMREAGLKASVDVITGEMTWAR